MLKHGKVKWFVKGILLFFVIVFAGYHLYCHYMVKKFMRCMEAGDWEAALVQVEKMPNVNMLDMCAPLYCLQDILLQGSVRNKDMKETVTRILNRDSKPS